jgi:hypothetical protein
MLRARYRQLYCVRHNKFSDLYYVVYCMDGGDIFYEGTVRGTVYGYHKDISISRTADYPESLARFTSS